MDVFEAYQAAVRSWRERIDGLGEDHWSRPTPCSDWSVRELVHHIVYEQVWAPPLFAGKTIKEVGRQYEGELLGDDPIGAARAAADGALAATPTGEARDRIVHLSFGDVPASEYAMQLTADHLIHGWDMAAGAGLSREMPPELVDTVARWFAAREDLYRSIGAIGDRVDLPEDASPADRLLAGFGRDPAWSAPTHA